MTGILIFCNRAPIIWHSKRQNGVETSTFGSEFTAMKNAVELIAALRYKHRMFSVQIDGSTDMFCEIEAVYKNASIPESQLQKKHHSIAYHMIRKSVASGAYQIAKETQRSTWRNNFIQVLPRPRRKLLLNKFTYWIKGRDEISNRWIADRYIGWGDRINPATMGYISVVIPPVKVNCAEEGIVNTKYILLWF